MKKLIELNDSDIGLKPILNAECTPKTSARAIVIKNNLIALIHVNKDKYYKLPGGSVEPNEKIKEGLYREILEEVGCTAKVIAEVGKIVENRTIGNRKYTSHCFITKFIKEGKINLTDFETEHGFELIWISIDKAINFVENSNPIDYNGKFNVKRDIIFLTEAKKILKNLKIA